MASVPGAEERLGGVIFACFGGPISRRELRGRARYLLHNLPEPPRKGYETHRNNAKQHSIGQETT